MNLARLIPLLIALGTAHLAHAIEDCELNGQAINISNGNLTAGKTGLVRCKDRDSGLLRREEELQNGVFMGLRRHYDGDGKLTLEMQINAKGNRQGLAREFSAQGHLLHETRYDNGQETGLERSFYPSGKLQRVSFYDPQSHAVRAQAQFSAHDRLMSLRCGDQPLLAPHADDAQWCGFGGRPAQVDLFDARGVLHAHETYLNGKRLRSETFYENGKPARLEEIEAGRSVERRWSADGTQRYEATFALDGGTPVRVGEKEFSDQGTLLREQHWSPAGELRSEERYYLNGQPRSKTVYSGEKDQRMAEVTQFQDNGQRTAQGYFVAAPRGSLTPIGVQQRFGGKGQVLAEDHYDAQGRITRERTWDDGGKLLRDDEIFADGSRKAHSK